MLTQLRPPTRTFRPGSGLRKTMRAVAATCRNRRAGRSPRSSPSRTSSANPSSARSEPIDSPESECEALGVSGQVNGPAQVGDAERQVATDLPAQASRDCASQRFAGSAVQWDMERVDPARAVRPRRVLRPASPTGRGLRSTALVPRRARPGRRLPGRRAARCD